MQMDLYEFQITLVYKVNSRPAKATSEACLKSKGKINKLQQRQQQQNSLVHRKKGFLEESLQLKLSHTEFLVHEK